jgi:hypothetical protein
MSDSRSLGTSPYLPPSEINRRVMKALGARDGAVYREHNNRDGYEIIERSRAENVANRDTLSQCITNYPGKVLRPYLR